MKFDIVIALVGLTVYISYMAFNNASLKARLMHIPYQVKNNGEYHRWLTSGFVHADWIHLGFNMLALYLFGRELLTVFSIIYDPAIGAAIFILFYLAAIVLSSIPDMIKYKDTPSYGSLGASGGVSAIVFACVMFMPTSYMGLIFIPISIPAFIFAILFVGFSFYQHQKGGDNINHLAHISGGLVGIIFPVILDPQVVPRFFDQIQRWIEYTF